MAEFHFTACDVCPQTVRTDTRYDLTAHIERPQRQFGVLNNPNMRSNEQMYLVIEEETFFFVS